LNLRSIVSRLKGRATSGFADLDGSFLSHVRLPVWVIDAFALTIVIGCLAMWSWSDFADCRSDAETIVSATALIMEDHARDSLDAIDRVLESVVASIKETGIQNLGSGAESERLRRLARPLPTTATIIIADHDGNIVAAVPSLPSPPNVSDRHWFRNLKEGSAGPQVGRARDGADNDWFFPISRAIRGPDKAFVGAVQIRIGLAPHFANVFRSLESVFSTLIVKHEAKLELYRAKDGAVVAGFPVTKALRDEPAETSPYVSLSTNLAGDSWTGWARVGGEDHLVATRRLIGWPLIAGVSLPASAIYTQAWWRLLWHSTVAAVTIAALSMLTLLSARQARREAALMGELEHRVKNTLAVVEAVIERAHHNTQSSDEFVASLRGRIRSIAGTQNLLSASHWRGVDLANLVRAELEPYTSGTNTGVEGPPVYLTPTASNALAMVLHELATNAAKYGALSQEAGSVSVRWTLPAENTCGAMLWIEWQEAGGPEVAVPVRKGYGTSVIRDLLGYGLGARVDLIFAASGVRCTIELPVNRGTMREAA
jgi:two-component sensor histidine kinase